MSAILKAAGEMITQQGSSAMDRQRLGSKADQVYVQIKEAILSGALEPGSAIDKIAMCEHLGVSRFPVSTAINRLAYERLILIEPQRGSFVTKIAVADVREWMMIRRALEAEIASQLALDFPPDISARLVRNMRYQQSACQAGDNLDFYLLDIEFHRLIAGAQGLGRAVEILEGLRSHLERVRRLLLTPPARKFEAYAEHERIVAALEAGDGRAAGAAMRVHLEMTTQFFESYAGERQDFFTA